MPDEPTKLDRIKELIAKRKKKKQEMLDGRYEDLQEYEESDEERDLRIFNTDEAWTNT